jgi:hypothetical protein
MKPALFCFLMFSMCSAQAAVYRLDTGKVAAEDREMVEATCVTELKVKDSRSAESEIISQILERRMSVEKIEGSKSTLTTDGADAYSGEIKTGVYIVKQNGFGSYFPYIAKRVEINRYRTALTVRIELLNHRDSAELAEESVCGNLSYLESSDSGSKR